MTKIKIRFEEIRNDDIVEVSVYSSNKKPPKFKKINFDDWKELETFDANCWCYLEMKKLELSRYLLLKLKDRTKNCVSISKMQFFGR